MRRTADPTARPTGRRGGRDGKIIPFGGCTPIAPAIDIPNARVPLRHKSKVEAAPFTSSGRQAPSQIPAVQGRCTVRNLNLTRSRNTL